MADSLDGAIAWLTAQVAQGTLQLARDKYNNIELPTFTDITKPTSYTGLTGFLPGDYRGPYAGQGAWDTLNQTAQMFGRTGNDERWGQLGYDPGTQTLGGRAATLAEDRYKTIETGAFANTQAGQDTKMAMEYGGGTIVGGTPAPDWMKPHAAWAQKFARANNGRPPTQEELTKGVSGDVLSAITALRENAEYKASDITRKIQMESQAVAGATGMDPVNAANVVQDLRANTRNTGRQSNAQEIVDSVGRWQDPTDPTAAVNQAMTRLRQDPEYQQMDGDQRVRRESEEVAKAVGMPLENARRVVTELRSASRPSGTLSSNEAVARAVQRNLPPGTDLNQSGRQASPVYGQMGSRQEGGRVQGGPVMAADQGAQDQMAGLGPQPNPVLGQGNRFSLQGAGQPAAGGLGGVNFAGTGAPSNYGNAAMSPEQRQLAEQARQADLRSQLELRSQDLTNQLQSNQQRITEEENLRQNAIAQGNLAVAQQHEQNITALQTRTLDLQQQKQASDLGLEQGKLTGQYGGQETQAAKEARLAEERARGVISGELGGVETQAAKDARLAEERARGIATGQIGGQETVEARNTRLAEERARAGMVGAIGGQETVEARTQRQANEIARAAEERQREALYGGAGAAAPGAGGLPGETLEARKQREQNLLQQQQLAATLRGPADIVQYARVVGGTPGGINDLIGAATGRYQPASQGDVSANPQAASFASLPGGGQVPTITQTQQGQGGGLDHLYARGAGAQAAPQRSMYQGAAPGSGLEGGPPTPAQVAMAGRENGMRTANATFQPIGARNTQEIYRPPPGAGPQTTGTPSQQQTQQGPMTGRVALGGGVHAAQYNQGVMHPAQPSSSDQVLAASSALASPDQWSWQGVDRLAPTNRKMLYALSEGQGRQIEDINATRDKVLGRYKGPSVGRVTPRGF